MQGSQTNFRKSILSGSSLAALLAIGTPAAHANDLPTGGTVAAGTASINSNANSMTVTQTSNRAVMNWTSFSVGQGKSVTFNQPDVKSATLNRVTGATTSQIAGQITSNGAIYLINPNGIAITSTGSVTAAGGFVASTLNMTDSDFMAGANSFTGNGASGRVSNAGQISTGEGAFVALLGGSVSNNGSIIVPYGRVGLGSGEAIALDLNGGNFLRVAVPTEALADTLVDHAGSITAAGGLVELRTATVKDAVRNVINLSGAINADSASGSAGNIILHGGDGGTATFHGQLSARATGETGDGGLIETSGADVQFSGLVANASSANGKTGTWVIDPVDLTVDAAAAATISSNLASANVTLETTATTASGIGSQTVGAGDITLNGAISWSSDNSLLFSAHRNININANITNVTSTVANARFLSDNDGSGVGTVTFAPSAQARLPFAIIYYNPASNPYTATPSVNSTSYLTPENFSSNVTTVSPFYAYQKVNNVYDLQNIKNNLNGQYALGRSIDASITSTWNSGAGFVPIGTDGAGIVGNGGNGFAGRLHGLDFAINGLVINRPNANFVGLFGYAHTSARIFYVRLNGGSVSGNSQVGGLVGQSKSFIATGYSTASVTGAGGLVGGLVGSLTGGIISGSYASGFVSGGGSGVGGLVGSQSAGSISGTYSLAAVSAGTNSAVGGLVGSQTGGSISNSYATGLVSGTGTNIAGLVGANLGGTLNSSYWDSYSTGRLIGVGAAANAGVIAVTSSPTQSSATNYAFKQSAYTNLTAGGWIFFDGRTRPFLMEEQVSRVFAGAPFAGTAKILNANQLQLINASEASLAQSYVLLSDINLSATEVYSQGAPGSHSGMWSETGFVPIGSASPFTGVLDGQGNVIASLTVNDASRNYAGLFGLVSGSVRNFRVSGNVTGGFGTGGVAGYLLNGGSISSVESYLRVSSSQNALGGLVGLMDAGAGGIADSIVWEPVSGTGSYVGGFVGQMLSGTISNVTSLGSVTGASMVGGLVGFQNGGTINASHHVNGAVAASSDYAGGLVGFLANGGTVNGSNAGSNVSGAQFVGGVVGRAVNGTIVGGSFGSGRIGIVDTVSGTNYIGGVIGYLDGAATLNGAGVGSNVAVKATSTAAGGVVGFSAGTIEGQVNVAGPIPGATDRIDTIVSGGVAVGGLVGQQEGGSINCSDIYVTCSSAAGVAVSGTIYVGGAIGLQGAGSSMKGVLGGNATGTQFVGGLIGYSHTGTGMIVNSTGGSAQGVDYVGGLAGLLGSGTITNGRANSGAAGDRNVGGLVGIQTGGEISLSRAKGSVTGSGASVAIGGLVGFQIGGSIVNSAVDPIGIVNGVAQPSTVSGIQLVGGLVGLQGSGSIASSSSSANVTATGTYAGGLVGFQTNAASISSSSASGAVVGTQFAGGLVGRNAGGTITGGTASGSVQGSDYVGGLVGWQDFGSTLSNGAATGQVAASGNYAGGLLGYAAGTISNSSSQTSASVAGGLYVGGLVGAFGGGSITSSLANRPVSGTQSVGGLVGWLQSGSISLSKASNTVNGTQVVGGLIGEFTNGSVDQSYSSAIVTGSGQYVGGLVGILNGGNITNAYATGATSGNNLVGGLIGYQAGGAVSQTYAIGAVNGLYKGGLIGFQAGGSLTSSVWDTQTTGQSAGRGDFSGGTFGATGYLTNQLQDTTTISTNYTGWNFNTIWRLPNQPGQSGNPAGQYPILLNRP